MRFQTSATLLALLAFYSVQVLAQDNAVTDTQVSVPTDPQTNVPDVPDSSQTPSPDSPDSDADSNSPQEPDDSDDAGAPEQTPSDDSSAPGQGDGSNTEDSDTQEPSPSEDPSNDTPQQPQPTGAPVGDGECQEGQYKCVDESSPAFQWCVSGAWTQNTCAEGTVCQATEGNSVSCVWPDSVE
ncbi:hypothetical protein K493DRAFT_301217 [Basidiobolus meristosporus CBS 931.73]|uniref:Carbohydrate-binding module family 19 domain-containing protein n=1 Tax=Basidiobolus meristosporus CBS 931.73 TaxID=1314790 RepID=A0A1Y1YD35_9FUNG|nr:hypothetical protein K493DRAFT_301217 [Basidiobolus meristosporus CBS 931.73]|eukprot:ORX95843.1 hypothetical protein K493DRAFT_301217 [Basidiobolus meristosporus CBS 931.73]